MVFDVVPNQGPLRLTKATALAATQGAAAVSTSTWPNPFADQTTLAMKGSFPFAVCSGEGPDTVQLGGQLAAGAYLGKVSQAGKVSSSTISKK